MGGPLPAEDFHVEALVDRLREWVEVESPTTAPEAVNRAMGLAAEAVEGLGGRVTRHPGRDGFGDAVVGRLSPGDEPGILVLGHLDTVHPVGTASGRLPLRREGDRLYGPGTYDMKGGLVCALEAARLVLERDGGTPLPVTFMFIPDEEFGSPTTRGLIEAEAKRSSYVLVPEPAQERGDLITGRWAFQRFVLRTSGRPAHAGATLAEGRSALRAMAELVGTVEDLSDPSRHISLSVGVMHAGSFVNVVPAECVAEVLGVAADEAGLEEVRARMLGLAGSRDGVELQVRLGPTRPLFSPTEAGLELYEHARAIANEIGFDPGHGNLGGGSDGNFTGALGVPTLDGLGVCGGGFHTFSEHALVSSLVPRARLMSGLLRTLR